MLHVNRCNECLHSDWTSVFQFHLQTFCTTFLLVPLSVLFSLGCFAFTSVSASPPGLTLSLFLRVLQAQSTHGLPAPRGLGAEVGGGRQSLPATQGSARPAVTEMDTKGGSKTRPCKIPRVTMEMAREPTFWYSSDAGTGFYFISFIRAMLDPWSPLGVHPVSHLFIKGWVPATHFRTWNFIKLLLLLTIKH